jgi:hypothetical protein
VAINLTCELFPLQFFRTVSPSPSYKVAVSALFVKYCWRRSAIVQYDGVEFSSTASAWQEALESQTQVAVQCQGVSKTTTQILKFTGGVGDFTNKVSIIALLQKVLGTRFRIVIALAKAEYLTNLALQATGTVDCTDGFHKLLSLGLC